jgi:hypothetical protein
VAARFEWLGSSDPWCGRQPRYERLTTDGRRRGFLHARLPSGEPVRVRLGRFSDPAELRERIVVAEVQGSSKPRRLLARLHNPGGDVCACLPECWCKRSRLGYAVRWYVPARWHRLPPPPHQP